MKDGVVRSEWSGGQGLRRLGQPTLAAATVPTTTEPEVDELYEAQIRKLSHIIKKAKIFPGHRVLEIGSVRVHAPLRRRFSILHRDGDQWLFLLHKLSRGRRSIR